MLLQHPLGPRAEIRRRTQLHRLAEPPVRYIEIALLRSFQHVVVGVAFKPDLRRHAVEALRALLGPRQHHVRNGARNMTPQGASCIDRGSAWVGMRREYGFSASYRF